MTAVRWEGLTHAEIYARVQAGPGRGASLAVESAWADTEAMVHRIEERLAAVVARSGGGWEGAAGDAARSAVSPLGRWAADAAGDARLTATGVTAQAEQAAWLRSAMPSPTVPLWDEPSGRAAVDPLFLLQDTQALEQRSAADAAQAVHLMNTYTNNSYENRRLLDFWTLPPHVAADAGGPSPAPGGAGAGTAVARATGFGAIGRADGVGGPAGPGVSPAGAGRPGGPGRSASSRTGPFSPAGRRSGRVPCSRAPPPVPMVARCSVGSRRVWCRPPPTRVLPPAVPGQVRRAAPRPTAGGSRAPPRQPTPRGPQAPRVGPVPPRGSRRTRACTRRWRPLRPGRRAASAGDRTTSSTTPTRSPTTAGSPRR